MKIECQTLFDCSYTGVTGHFRSGEIPFVDRAGQHIADQHQWNRSRNQQRNYETLMQIIGLRTQPQNITLPKKVGDLWQFEFEAEAEGVFEVHGDLDPLAGLKFDCEGVPMMINLNEKPQLSPTICISGEEQNIWFSTVNTSLE